MVLMPNNPTKEQVFEQEFYPLANDLYNFAYRLTLNSADAEDLVQEAFMKAFRFIDSYQVGTNPKAWLFRILKNAFINKYRKDKSRPEELPEKLPEGKANDLSEEMFNSLMGDEVTMAINSLSVEFRTVILLCDIERFTYEEISKIIEKPIGTVRSRLFRARNALKEKLRTYAESRGYKDQRK